MKVLFANAQEPYYQYFEFLHAVDKGSRTTTGYPGKNYQKNFSDYKIEAEFNPSSRILKGKQTIVFHNNVANLEKIVFNLYRNVFKKDAQRAESISPKDVCDGMVIDSINLDGQSVKFEEDRTKLYINKRVDKGQTVSIYFEWNVVISAFTQHRGGKYNDDSWFVPYFYPQLAVYDDVYGWDEIYHTINEEFYQEYADYDFSLKIDDGSIVWATGELQNAQEIFTQDVYSRIQKSQNSDKAIDILDKDNFDKALKQNNNTWHFVAKNVPDVCFCISKSSLWNQLAAKLDKNSDKKTLIGSIYRTSKFAEVTYMTKQTLEFLSSERPNVAYPWPHMTVFEGGGGMEFPMMVNQSSKNGYNELFFVTSHEVTHSYFPFLTGMNQAKYGFMDEGLNMFVAQDFQTKNYHAKRDEYYRALYTYLYFMGKDVDWAVATPTFLLNDLWAKTLLSYYKPQVMYTILEDIVGKQTMDKILEEFTKAWLYKHPHPCDFMYMCNTVSGKNLNWFFNKWMFNKGICEIALEDASNKKQKQLKITSLGNLPVFVDLIVTLKNNTKEILHYDASYFKDNSSFVVPLKSEVKSVELNTSKVPDADDSNNRVLFK